MDKEYLKQHYIKHYGESDTIKYSYCPYRICPLGAHVDHQLGIVTGFALNYGIGISYSVNDDGLCQLVSHNFKLRKRFYINDFMEKLDDWADYIRGSIKILQKEGYKLTKGINCYIYGELPIGGLSSSAAIIIAFLQAITKANDINLTAQQLIEYSYYSETKFMGMSIGKLDQSCEVLSKKDKLLVLDTKTGEYKTVEKENNSTPYAFLIIHSGAERLLAGSKYNVRVDECKSAAYYILSMSGQGHRKYNDAFLRDIPYALFTKYKDNLPENFKKRALHFYNENDRVINGEIAWANGDIVTFGKLVTESGNSSIELYESGSDVLIDLHNIITSTPNVYGGRFMGGGFNGACLAIINPEYAEEIMESIKSRYIELHPEYKDKVQLILCISEDGVGEHL